MVSLRRCVPLALVAVLLSAIPGGAQGAAQRVAVGSWPSTTYYLGYPEYEAAQSGQIRITAGGAYTLYLNGDLVGSDADVSTVETWDVEFSRRANEVAIVVEHDGQDTPYGVFCILESDESQLVSTPFDRTTPWFWTGFELPNEEGADWTELRLSSLDRHEEDGQTVTWSPVQAGSLDPRSFADFADLDLTRARAIAGFPGGLDGSGGPLQLRSLDGLNLAFASLSDDPNIVDGDISSAKTFARGATALFDFVETDLGRLVPIERVRVVTRPPNSGSFADNSLRGYSVLVSKDGVNFIEIAARNQIEDYRETEVTFPVISARHVRVVVTEFSDRDASPQVGEVEVYGEGVVPAGTFRSPGLDLGVAGAKNFGRVQVFGEIPRNGDLQLRFRSGDDGDTWSDWGPWHPAGPIELGVPEPASLLQYEVRMSTRDLRVGPRLDSLVIDFDDADLPAERVAASIAPQSVPIGRDTSFVYTVDVEIGAASAGVERLVVLTASPAAVDLTAIAGVDADAIDAANSYATADSLVIAFSPPLTQDTQLQVPFTTRLISASHDFAGALFAPGGDNGLRAGVRDGDDPDTGLPLTRTVAAETFDMPVLSQVRAVPGVVTPNGDAINDEVAIGFVLGRVTSADVRVEILDLSGRRLRQLGPMQSLAAGSYLPTAGRALGRLPGLWDGTDDDGNPVAPGTYLYRVIVDLEPDDAVAIGLVGVAY